MDCFAVSISSGLVLNKIEFKDAAKIAFSFAFFQAMMPTLGWIAGSRIEQYIKEYDHWIAFGLLFLIGAKMIFESLKSENRDASFNPLNPKVLLLMSLATSIDALVVGISFAFIDYKWFTSGLIIGSTTFIISMLGILFGKKTGERFGKRMEIVGGLILIGMGVNFLLNHLVFG